LQFILTTGFFVVVSLLAGTDFCPCCTHAATLLNHGSKHNVSVCEIITGFIFYRPDGATLLNDAEKFELSRQKRQTAINTGFDGKNFSKDIAVSISVHKLQLNYILILYSLYSEKESSISSAYRTVHCRIFGKIPHDFSCSTDSLRSSMAIARTVSQ
jgi:hypothetical protein